VLEVRDFLDQVFQEDEGYICAWFMHRGTGKTKEAQYDIRQNGIKKLIEACDSATTKGWDCYYVPSVFKQPRRTKEYHSHSNVLWADFDSGNGLPEFEISPSMVVSSSTGKYHTYWALDSPVALAELEHLNRGIAYAFGADKSGWDGVQLLRIPNTYNYKYEKPEPVLLASASGLSYDVSMFTGFLMGSLQRRFPSKNLASLRVWI